MIWAAAEFRAKFESYKTATSHPDAKADAYAEVLIANDGLPDAKDFIRSRHFWVRKPTPDQLHHLLCACEAYGFLRCFPVPDRPPFPFPFIIDALGLKEADRASKSREGWSFWQKAKHWWEQISKGIKFAVSVILLLASLIAAVTKFVVNSKELKNATTTQATSKPVAMP